VRVPSVLAGGVARAGVRTGSDADARGFGENAAMLPALALLALAQAGPSLLPPPAGWRAEHLEFPLDFAPEIELAGYEDLAFAPGMFVADSDSYFSYALALRLTGDVEVDEAFLDSFLERYYRGLCGAVGAERKLTLDLTRVRATVKRAGERFTAEVEMFDPFVTGGPLTLALELESRAVPRATEVLGLASPLDREAPVWKELHALGERWRAQRAAPVLLNHVFFVVERETYDALLHSEFLRTEFAVGEERETVRKDGSYRGLYLYGQHTYLEFLPPGAAGLAAGTSGLALGLESAGASEALAKRLRASQLNVFDVPVTRALGSEALPWFRLLGVEMPGASLQLFTLEYDERFLARWHPEFAPAAPGISRGDVLTRYAASLDALARHATAPFADVSSVELALDDAQRERVLAGCAAFGYEPEGDEPRLVHAPQFQLTLLPSAQPAGVTGVELRLRRELTRAPLEFGRARLEFRGRTASLRLAPRAR